jgi:hypothetical protein
MSKKSLRDLIQDMDEKAMDMYGTLDKESLQHVITSSRNEIINLRKETELVICNRFFDQAAYHRTLQVYAQDIQMATRVMQIKGYNQ